MEFSYFLPVNIQFGWNKVDSVADYVASYGKKALIVTGRTSAKKSGLYDRVVAKLETAHIDYVLFDQVDANPLTTTALEGAALAKSESCDMVIAIGGGSIMDLSLIHILSLPNGVTEVHHIYDKFLTVDKTAIDPVIIEGNGYKLLITSYFINPVSYTHLDVYKRQA